MRPLNDSNIDKAGDKLMYNRNVLLSGGETCTRIFLCYLPSNFVEIRFYA